MHNENIKVWLYNVKNRRRKLMFNINNSIIHRGMVGVGLTDQKGVFFDGIKVMKYDWDNECP